MAVALAKMDDPIFYKHLYEALDDKDPTVRRVVVHSLRVHKKPEAVDALVKRFQKEEDPVADLELQSDPSMQDLEEDFELQSGPAVSTLIRHPEELPTKDVEDKKVLGTSTLSMTTFITPRRSAGGRRRKQKRSRWR